MLLVAERAAMQVSILLLELVNNADIIDGTTSTWCPRTVSNVSK